MNIREPLKPLGDAADREIRAAVQAAGLSNVSALWRPDNGANANASKGLAPGLLLRERPGRRPDLRRA